MQRLQHPDLLSYSQSLQTGSQDGQTRLWDPVRRKWTAHTPEELVRQLFLRHLLTGLSASRIGIERSFNVHGRARRFDLVIFSRALTPLLLAEFKRPDIPLGPAVFEQAALYNFALRAPYLLMSNGLESYCCSVDFSTGRLVYAEELPWDLLRTT